MFEEPAAVHELMDRITEALIRWVRVQKEYNGEPADASNGLQGVWSPKGTGIWLSDDDLVSVGPAQYEEFVVPYYSRIFEAFGGGRIHYCGSGTHQIGNILRIRNLTAVNNSPMGDYETFGKLARGIRGKAVLQIQDAAPLTPEDYYPRLFEGIDDFSGMMLATFAEDHLALTNGGATIDTARDPLEAANRISHIIRDYIDTRMNR
jgi:hypothetical protein